MTMLNDRARRRLAIQIAAQLPEDERDALAVLRYAAELVSGFLEGRADAEKHALTMVSRAIAPEEK